MEGKIMANTLAFCRTQILYLNSRLINSEIELNDYRRSVEALLSDAGWLVRVECDSIAFSSLSTGLARDHAATSSTIR
jgi:hypothetical protein